ncbi:GNAT family N-acetyltransferase [Paenibacillus sp. YYML68]|uniref:GNAT family N-acetyltransferase n=1 Tax=Paenibacillus sp. YYML68 TaxID=2909250 RepID=UPI0024910349|nr:GNAT family N-acetyltransferase [Paenibacillus sp. YYML68]
MKEFVYRVAPADINHIEPVRTFVMGMMNKLYPAGAYNPDPDDLAHFEETYIRPGDASFLIAEDVEGRIIGAASVRPYNDRFPYMQGLLGAGPVCEMCRFYVDDSWRRRGVGAQLYAGAEAYARQAGYQESYLHTSVYLPGGFPFWTSRGYEELYWETQQIVHMGKRLT